MNNLLIILRAKWFHPIFVCFFVVFKRLLFDKNVVMFWRLLIPYISNSIYVGDEEASSYRSNF